jgi:hypothetical protein
VPVAALCAPGAGALSRAGSWWLALQANEHSSKQALAIGIGRRRVTVLHGGRRARFSLRKATWLRACSARGRRGSLAGMARAAVVLCAVLVGAGCADNPYVIGRFADAGSDECAQEHASALACSGFEARDVAADWDAVAIEESGAVERSTARAHHGRAALHATSEDSDSVAVVSKTFAPLRSGAVDFRAYVYVPSGVQTQTMNIFFVGYEPTPDPFQGVDFNLEDGAVQVYSPQATPDRQTGTLHIPRDRWFCFRAHVVISDDRNEGAVQAFIDDTLALDATMIDTLPMDGVRQFRAGVDWSSEQTTPFAIYLDDVVLDTKKVTCR